MKNKIIVALMTVMLAGSIAACGAKGTEGNDSGKGTESAVQQETVDPSEPGVQVDAEEGTSSGNKEIDALIQEENQLFIDHEDAWGKVFAAMDKTESAKVSEGGEAYVAFLRETVEKIGDTLDDKEKQILEEDIKKVDEIEKKVTELMKGEK